jgi:hypothetical protein
MRMRVCLVVLVGVAGVLLAGCGGSSGSSSGSAGSGASTPASGSSAQAGSGGSTGAGASEASSSPKPAQLPSGTVARVGGTPITTAAYNHQLQVSAPATVKPLIANPSDYSGCIAAVKSREERNQKLIKESEERSAKRLKGRKAPGLYPGNRKATTEAQRKQQCELQYKAQKQQAVSTLIRRAWTEAQAKELGVSVNENEVAKQVKTREESQKRLAKSSRYSEFAGAEANYSKAVLMEMVKSEVLETHINTKIREKFTKLGAVSEEKLEKYFNEHKQVYAQPERRSIVFVTTKSQSVAEVIAKEHSGALGSAASKHGIKAMPTTLGCQRPSGAKSAGTSIVAEAICSAKSGVISAPVKVASTFYVFEVKSVIPAAQPSFAQEKEQIKQLLASQGQEQGMFKYSEGVRTKLKDQTECAAGYVVPLCKEYVAPKPTLIIQAKRRTP